MTLPGFLIGSLLAITAGLVFHLFKGGSFWRLVYYVTISCIGFMIGQALGNKFHLIFIQIGPLNAGSALLGSITFLLIGYWLSLFEVRNKE